MLQHQRRSLTPTRDIVVSRAFYLEGIVQAVGTKLTVDATLAAEMMACGRAIPPDMAHMLPEAAGEASQKATK